MSVVYLGKVGNIVRYEALTLYSNSVFRLWISTISRAEYMRMPSCQRVITDVLAYFSYYTGLCFFETQIIEIRALEIWEYMRKYNLHHPANLILVKFPIDEIKTMKTDFIGSFGFSGEVLPYEAESGYVTEDWPEPF